MRSLTYAGETVLTTNDVAAVIIDLTAELAKIGLADAVEFPIVRPDGSVGTAELVAGVGNDVLSVPADWEGAEPDVSEALAALRHRLHRLRPTMEPRDRLSVVEDDAVSNDGYDPDLDGQLRG
ncbi:hypothetical protein [Microbacterium sp. 10M-3C3]|jgi:hypothetical protein|uniref:hypothetical protein n=1 Tax=Microbacterium sp. 10M-3C3 TaxID=2483401 RepID=UPI001F0BB5A2|nr:hypothetical protein [Microbacterium sp. 10M-3C3]